MFIKQGRCIWSEWIDSDCSVTCGVGMKVSRRYIRFPAEIDADGTCDNVTRKSETCDTNIHCKGIGK